MADRNATKLSTQRSHATFPTIVAVGRKLAPHEDFYHWILTLTWPRFFGALTIAFLVTNALFALAYMAQPGCVTSATTFADHFFFSVQTLATIGYGGMAPQTTWGNVVVSIEALLGIVGTAVITGLTFARFARPTARILFSEKAVVSERNGVPHLMFRMANWRRNQIVEAQLHVILLVSETTREGDSLRRPVTLDLVRSRNPMFALTWTAMHEIDEKSPFFGPDAMARLHEQKAELFLGLSGLDETLMQTITARHRYLLDDIVHDARFADILRVDPDGTRIIDYDRFHDIVPLEKDGR